MLKLSVFIFAVAALGGLVLAIRHFQGKNRPWLLSILHGLLGAAGLALLGIPVAAGNAPALGKAALGLFVAAALGGFVLFVRHLGNKKLPSAVVVIHAGVAITAFVLLLAGLYL